MIDSIKTTGATAEKANAAFEQAAVKVIQRAKQAGTPIIVWENDHIKEVPAEELSDGANLKSDDELAEGAAVARSNQR